MRAKNHHPAIYPRLDASSHGGNVQGCGLVGCQGWCLVYNQAALNFNANQDK